MPNRADDYPVVLHPVQHDVRSASDYQFPNPRLGPDPAQMGMITESFDHGDDPQRQPFRRLRLVSSDVGANFSQARSCQSRPDNLYWHSASSSCVFPQAHFGTGNSFSVPHDSSHAFMSSFLM